MAKASARETKATSSAKKAPAKRASSRRPAASEQRICNLVPSRDTEGDWQFETAVASGALGAVAALPSKVDLRKTWWKVGDQEDTGSCVGWATAEGVVRYHMVTGGQARSERAAVTAVRVDGVEGDR